MLWRTSVLFMFIHEVLNKILDLRVLLSFDISSVELFLECLLRVLINHFLFKVITQK